MYDVKQWIPTRQTLLSRLKDWDDHDSWKEFFDVYWKLIYNTALKTGLNDAEAQEVVQETVISVSKAMPNFHYDPKIGSFKGWLMKQIGWRIADQFRKRRQGPDGRGSGGPDNTSEEITDEMIENIPDNSSASLEAIWDDEWQENLIEAALQRVKTSVDSKQYQIFDLYVIKKWPVAKIVKSLQVSRTYIYTAKHRISDLFLKELKTLENKIL